MQKHMAYADVIVLGKAPGGYPAAPGPAKLAKVAIRKEGESLGVYA